MFANFKQFMRKSCDYSFLMDIVVNYKSAVERHAA